MSKLYDENFSHMSPVWSRIFPIVAERAEGCTIYAFDGKKYLDNMALIAVDTTEAEVNYQPKVFREAAQALFG